MQILSTILHFSGLVYSAMSNGCKDKTIKNEQNNHQCNNMIVFPETHGGQLKNKKQNAVNRFGFNI